MTTMTTLPETFGETVQIFTDAMRTMLTHMHAHNCEHPDGWHITYCLRKAAGSPIATPNAVLHPVLEALADFGMVEMAWDKCQELCPPQNAWKLTAIGAEIASYLSQQDTFLTSV